MYPKRTIKVELSLKACQSSLSKVSWHDFLNKSSRLVYRKRSTVAKERYDVCQSFALGKFQHAMELFWKGLRYATSVPARVWSRVSNRGDIRVLIWISRTCQIRIC